MWVGPGGFIGNFAFRFTIEVLFFQTLSLPLCLEVIFLVPFYPQQALIVGHFVRHRFLPNAQFLQAVKRQETLQGRIEVSCCV